MKQLIESFVTVFLVLISVLIFAQFIGASMQIRAARQFHTMCIGQIESSDFDNTVIDACVEQAQKKGYQLNIQNIQSEELVCAECNAPLEEETAMCETCNAENAVRYLNNRLCNVQMTYDVEMALIQLKKEGVLYGVAR